jgi:Domain of unknown function (DU1801)
MQVARDGMMVWMDFYRANSSTGELFKSFLPEKPHQCLSLTFDLPIAWPAGWRYACRESTLFPESAMQSKATTVAEYLASLPEERRKVVEAVRKVIRANLDKQYEEGMQYGMIGYYVPHKVFPAGYHCDPKQPLPFAALASQKNHLSLYLMGIYCGHPDGANGEETAETTWFRTAWAKTGKKLDMGKSCVRFKKVEDLALDVIGEAIKRVPARTYIERYQAVLAGTAKGRTAKPTPAKSTKSTTAATAIKAGKAK